MRFGAIMHVTRKVSIKIIDALLIVEYMICGRFYFDVSIHDDRGQNLNKGQFHFPPNFVPSSSLLLK